MDRRLCGAATASLLVLVLAGGCGADHVPEADTGSPQVVGRTGPTFEERLDLLPQSLMEESDQVLVQMADLAWAAELARVERPSGGTDEHAVWTYLRAVAGEPGADGERGDVAALLPLLAENAGSERVDEFEAELGWSVVDVDWYVEWLGTVRTMTVVGGGLVGERLIAAMGEPDGGVWQLGDAEGAPDLSEATAARPLGEPLWLQLTDEQLAVVDDRDVLEDIRAGEATMAEIPALRALAEAMDSEQAYSTLLRLGDPNQGRLFPESALETLREWALEPYLGVAAGLAHDGHQPYVVLAYAHADSGAAQANAELVREQIEHGSSANGRSWDSLFGVEDIRVDGTTVVARLAVREIRLAAAYLPVQEGDTLTFQR